MSHAEPPGPPSEPVKHPPQPGQQQFGQPPPPYGQQQFGQPLPPYGQTGPGPVGTLTPGAPPKKRRTWLIVLLAVGLPLLLIGGCGVYFLATVGAAIEDAASPIAPASSTVLDDPSEDPSEEPTEDVTEEPTEEPTEDQEGPQSLKVGESAYIEDTDSGATAAITLVKVIRAKCAYATIGCSKPENGAVYEFQMVMKVAEGKGSVTINPYDFYFETPDGERYDVYNGNSSEYGSEDTLEDSKVRAGRQVKGVLKFDTPKSLKGSYLVYAPNLDGDALAEWKLG